MNDRVKKILVYAVACPAFFFVSLVAGAYWTFPYDHLRDYLVQEVERGGTAHLEIESLEPDWLTGIELEGVRFSKVPDNASREPAVLSLAEAQARVSLLSLLVGTQEVSFDAEVEGGGTIEGSVALSEEQTHVVLSLDTVDLRRIGPLHDAVGLPIGGRASGTVDVVIAQEIAGTQGSADITVRGLSIGDGETPLVIEGLGAGLTLERMNLGTMQFRLRTQRGVGTIERLRADGEHAQLWGSGSVRLIQPLRMSSLDVLVRMKFKDAYRESSDRMRALFSLLELNPQVRPARTDDGALQWRVQGSFAGRVRMIPSGRSPMPGAN